jgi:hypothetical protein
MFKNIIESPTSFAPSVDAPLVAGFGTHGQTVSDELSKAIARHNRNAGSVITLIWRADAKCFVLKNSSGTDKASMQRVVQGVHYNGWKPVLAEKSDPLEDYTVHLQGANTSGNGSQLLFSRKVIDKLLEPAHSAGPAVPVILAAPSLNNRKNLQPASYEDPNISFSEGLAFNAFQGETGLADPQSAFAISGIAQGVFQGLVKFAKAGTAFAYQSIMRESSQNGLIFGERPEGLFQNKFRPLYNQTEIDFASPQAAFINSDIARGVLMGEAGITSADSRKHIIGSYGADPCVIVAMFHPASKRAALAHIDACVDIRHAIETLVARCTHNSDSKKLDVHLASGTLGGDNEIESKLRQTISYHEELIIRSEYRTDSLAIDAKNGTVHEGVKFSQLDHGEGLDARLEERLRVAEMAWLEIKEPLIMRFDG